MPSPASWAAATATGSVSTSGARRPWPSRGTRRSRSCVTTIQAPPSPRSVHVRRAGSLGGILPISWTDFERVDMRVGIVREAEPFPEARKPAIKLRIDFGELGVKRSSAQITDRYTPKDLVGRRVVAVVNFPPKQIGPLVSEVLVLGAYGERGEVILLRPDFEVAPGAKIG